MDLRTDSSLTSQAFWLGERVVTLRPCGELRREEIAFLVRGLSRLRRFGCRFVVLDVSRVTHLDYRGVAALKNQVESLRRSGGDVKLAGLSSYLHAILRAGGADQVFQAFTSPDAASAAFGPAPGMQLH